jgi:hypothetical protein
MEPMRASVSLDAEEEQQPRRDACAVHRLALRWTFIPEGARAGDLQKVQA